jgi:hypothetical protein
MGRRVAAWCGVLSLVAGAHAGLSAQRWVHPLTEYGQPDIQGNWTNATLTTFERAPGLGRAYSDEDAARIEGRERSSVEQGLQASDADRAPPEVTGSIGESYNQIYYDRGDRLARVNGEARTSLVTFPADGRIPALTSEGARRKRAWEELRGRFGEFDHPELRPLAERCIVFYGSSSNSVMGPPMSPTRGYNNNFTILQNADHVVIRSEMIHDVRIIRLGVPERMPADVRPWFGESWGRWEGNTLVVETTNMHLRQGPREQTDKILQSSEATVVERFTRTSDDDMLYEFRVHDPGTYSEDWGGEVPWTRFGDQIYEYACHEGNYALESILSGARYQEREGAGR